jgi:glycosyltransferase involved in cell wall biosynthesis
MSKKIAFFHNLPGGGGIRMEENIISRYKNKFEIDLYVIGENIPSDITGVNTIFIKQNPWKGFIFRNLWIFFVLPLIHKNIAKQINKKYQFIFITHDYFTKSPYLLRYINIDNVYLCQEPQREFYEPSVYHAPLLKDKIANCLRYPIKIIDEVNVSHAKHIVCNSQYSKKIIDSVYKKNSEVIYPGVDTKIFKPTLNSKQNIILCIGGINRIKSQYYFAKALKPLLSKYQLILVGNGRQEYLNKINKDFQQSELHIINKISDKELINYYSKSKVTCNVAYKEPFGLSSIESQACGTAVVSVDEGGTPETIINGKTGYICKRDENEILRATSLVLNKCNQMGANARKNIVNNWNWEKTLKPLDKYFPK